MEAVVMLGFFALITILSLVLNPHEGQDTFEPSQGTEVLGFGSGSD